MNLKEISDTAYDAADNIVSDICDSIHYNFSDTIDNYKFILRKIGEECRKQHAKNQRSIEKIKSLRDIIGSRIGIAAKNDDKINVDNFTFLVKQLDEIFNEINNDISSQT
mgnify:CR=1 FL=1